MRQPLVFLLSARWCWDPGSLLHPSALPVVLWGLGLSPVGPINAPRAGQGPEYPAQAASWASQVPFQPDAYLVLAVPAHDQVILVTACRMLGGQAEAAVPWQGEGQRVGELHWAGRGAQAGGMHQLEAKRVQGATLGATHARNLHKIQKLSPHLVPMPLNSPSASP